MFDVMLSTFFLSIDCGMAVNIFDFEGRSDTVQVNEGKIARSVVDVASSMLFVRVVEKRNGILRCYSAMNKKTTRQSHMLRDIFRRHPKITNNKMYTWLNHSQNFNPKLENVSFRVRGRRHASNFTVLGN